MLVILENGSAQDDHQGVVRLATESRLRAIVMRPAEGRR